MPKIQKKIQRHWNGFKQKHSSKVNLSIYSIYSERLRSLTVFQQNDDRTFMMEHQNHKEPKWCRSTFKSENFT